MNEKAKMKSAFCSHCFCSMLPNGDYSCCKCGRTAKESAVISFLDNYPQWNDGIFPEIKKLSMSDRSRLLSDEDLSLAVGYATPDSQAIDEYERSVAIAQDLRTSQWWMERMDKLFGKHKSNVCVDPEHAQCDVCSSMRRNDCIYDEWQKLKKMEMGNGKCM